VAEVIWTEPSFDQLNEIAEYIALDKPGAASTLVEKVLSAVEHLQLFPEAGHVPPELPQSVYRELYVRPCRIFYRQDNEVIFILYVMREERQLRQYLLESSAE
jgi:plasmid stabilization system protein ParE